MTQKQIAELFGKVPSTVNEHIKNIFSEGELQEKDVLRKFGISEFSTKPTNFYDLDVIISLKMNLLEVFVSGASGNYAFRINEICEKSWRLSFLPHIPK